MNSWLRRHAALLILSTLFCWSCSFLNSFIVVNASPAALEVWYPNPIAQSSKKTIIRRLTVLKYPIELSFKLKGQPLKSTENGMPIENVSSQTVASADWQTIDADGLFTFRLPKGFVKTDMMGVENYLGEYYRGQTRFLFVWHDTASYDYDEHLIRHLVEVSTTIDGKRASIRTFSVTRDRISVYVAEMNVGDWRNGKAELYMGLESANPGEVPTAKQIFKSTKFSKRRRANRWTGAAVALFAS